MSGLFGGGDDMDMPVIQAQNPSRAAESVATYGEGSDRQRRLMASMVTENWDEPLLGKRGLTGL